eukprot:6311025-Amphidinium_carterae.1
MRQQQEGVTAGSISLASLGSGNFISGHSPNCNILQLRGYRIEKHCMPAALLCTTQFPACRLGLQVKTRVTSRAVALITCMCVRNMFSSLPCLVRQAAAPLAEAKVLVQVIDGLHVAKCNTPGAQNFQQKVRTRPPAYS